VVGLQLGFGVATSQTPVAILLAKCPELLGGKATRTGMPGGPSLAAIVGLGRLDLVRITLGPLLASSNYFFALTLVVSEVRSGYLLLVVCCPLLLVLRNLFLVFFLILSSCLYPMGQVRPGFLIFSVLLQVFALILLCARPDADFALLPPASVIEFGELFRQATPFTYFMTYVSTRMVCPRSLLH
jgi:hypothetical protein